MTLSRKNITDRFDSSFGATMYSMNKLGEDENQQQSEMLCTEKENKLCHLVRNSLAILENKYKAANDPAQLIFLQFD